MEKKSNILSNFYNQLKRGLLLNNINYFFIWILTKLIRFYQQFISPHTLPSCRFLPTCSEYAISALQQKGLLKGSWLSAKRLLSCHPFRKSSVDEL